MRFREVPIYAQRQAVALGEAEAAAQLGLGNGDRCRFTTLRIRTNLRNYSIPPAGDPLNILATGPYHF